MFLKEISYAQQGCIYLFKNSIKKAILSTIIAIKNNWFITYQNVIYTCEAKLNF